MQTPELYKIYKQYPQVQTDTRKLKKGDLFFALKGPNFNANEFAAQALEAGAAYAVIDQAQYASDNRYIVVPDVLASLQDLALYHRQQFPIPFLAITGSNGKTTTKELITAVLRSRHITYATEGNLNNHIGIPLTLLKIKQDAQMAVIEMGANHQGEIASYCRIALPDHGLITNCGKAHIEGFGGIEGVRKGKGELFDFLRAHKGTIFRNTDLEYLADMANGIVNQITYGSANAQYIGKPLINDVFIYACVLTTGSETVVKSHLVGEYNFSNIMAAIAVGLHFNIPIDEIKTAINNYLPDNSRSQWLQQGSNKIILDAYNANPSSMRAAIINFARADLKNKILWLGGMKEMGQDEEEEHREIVRLIEEYNWQDIILVGKEFEKVKATNKWFLTSANAAEYIQHNTPRNASILIKGSRGSKMEVLLNVLDK
ncbi:MAG: UDP-N-acetylmuramoyl-tripeptide--D-alanyl-D-alanine ligase [Taibaiella sp.]|nr:UDP-N-acetylmuramoyl-tripeptide--D-alanyl-D-alanine ligase [Taibaiella sp.]